MGHGSKLAEELASTAYYTQWFIMQSLSSARHGELLEKRPKLVHQGCLARVIRTLADLLTIFERGQQDMFSSNLGNGITISEKLTFNKNYSELELTDESGNKMSLLRFIFDVPQRQDTMVVLFVKKPQTE